MTDTLDRIQSIVVDHLFVEADDVTSDANFFDDLGADSLDVVELVMAFEVEFGFEISDADAEAILTVGDAVKYIDRRLDGPPVAAEAQPARDEPKFKAGDRVRVVRHRAPAGNDVSSASHLVGTEVTLGDRDSDASTAGVDVFLVKNQYWLVRSDDIELVTTATPATAHTNDNSPIRTRREIVTGRYGGVEISTGGIPWGHKRIRFDAVATPSELREAAHLFNQLAEVLEENEGSQREAA